MPRSHGNEDESDEMVLGVLALMRRQAREKAQQREEKEKAQSRYPYFEKIKERAARAIAPLKPADEQSVAPIDPTQAFDIIARFESLLWTGWRAGAKLYIQDYELPTILSMAADGTYERAMSSEQTMVDFTEQLAKRIDDAANMDW